ncbi:MAG: hypothetical protein OEL78_07415, partial [Hyphomicrobiales bacterium]|nr:hypothetical protein [Hyphomicrobiales bacterium]
HGKARDWMKSAAVADLMTELADEAAAEAAAAQAMADALNALADYEAVVDGLDPNVEADAAAMADAQETLDAALGAAGVTQEEAEAAIGDGQTAAEAADSFEEEAAALAEDAEEAVADAAAAQAQSEALFEAVTKGKTPYDGDTADLIEQTLLEKNGWQELQDEAVAEAEAEMEAEAAEAEATAAEEDVVELKTGDGGTMALVVE